MIMATLFLLSEIYVKVCGRLQYFFIIIIIIVRDDTGSRFVVREGKVKETKLWPRDNNKYCRSRDLQPITYVPGKWSYNQTLNSVMHT